MVQVRKETKKSSKLWIISVLIVVVIIGSVFVYFMFIGKEAPKTETKNCGTNMDCFITASENCELSKVINNVTTTILGVKQTTTSYLEIKGMEAGKCIFYLRTENIDLTFPPEIPQETVNQQKEIYKRLEGRNGTCKFNTIDLTSMLNRWKVGSFSSGAVSCELTPSGNVCKTEGGDFGVAECQGDYFSQQI